MRNLTAKTPLSLARELLPNFQFYPHLPVLSRGVGLDGDQEVLIALACVATVTGVEHEAPIYLNGCVYIDKEIRATS